MSKPILGLILGAILGVLDGLTSLFYPEVTADLGFKSSAKAVKQFKKII